MDFSRALREAKDGESIIRRGWGEGDTCVYARFPDPRHKLTDPYLVISVHEGTRGEVLIPWQPSQIDLFADDWLVQESA